MTHLFDSVGFFLYLCEMEPISVNYPDSSLSDLTNPCTEVSFSVDYGTYGFYGSINPCVQITEEAMITFFRERMREMSLVHERTKMNGDRGVHLGYRDNKK